MGSLFEDEVLLISRRQTWMRQISNTPTITITTSSSVLLLPTTVCPAAYTTRVACIERQVLILASETLHALSVNPVFGFRLIPIPNKEFGLSGHWACNLPCLIISLQNLNLQPSALQILRIYDMQCVSKVAGRLGAPVRKLSGEEHPFGVKTSKEGYGSGRLSSATLMLTFIQGLSPLFSSVSNISAPGLL